MDMIRHQAVGDEAEFEAFAVMAQASQVKLSVRVVAKDGLALVPADDHMVQSAGELNPRRPCHGACDNMRYSSLTPEPDPRTFLFFSLEPDVNVLSMSDDSMRFLSGRLNGLLRPFAVSY